MRAALLIVLSLSALAMAGPAFNKNNQIDATNKPQWQQKQQPQHHQLYATNNNNKQQEIFASGKQTPAMETLKQWCFASQMSQQELTGSFKKLVSLIKASPEDKLTEQAVMEERICQGVSANKIAPVQQKAFNEQSELPTDSMVDTAAHELVKDVYMDALIACDSRHCTKQLIKIIDSQQVDTIRASYYMTRMAVTEKSSIKDDSEVRELSESFIQNQDKSDSELIERQKLFATTALLGKQLEGGKQQLEKEPKKSELVKVAQQVAKTIVQRHIKSVSQEEVLQCSTTTTTIITDNTTGTTTTTFNECDEQLVKKIAKRSAAIKALCNIPTWILKDIPEVEQTLVEIVANKDELVTVRQSAIECLEQNERVHERVLKQIVFKSEEPIEVRVAAYRAIMTVPFAQEDKTEEQKEEMAAEIVGQFIDYCQEERSQQEDKQFVLYVISHLENLRTCQQPELEAIKQVINKNKQHAMQVQVLCQKFRRELGQVGKYSRNYKLEQQVDQIKSGFIVEGDIIFENSNQYGQYNKQQVLPKVVRVNMSMPVMGETLNVVEITLRQNQMDQQLLKTLDLIKGAKFNKDSVNKVVESFKTSVEQQQQQPIGGKQTPEADLTIKVEGCTVIYMSTDDFKWSQQQQQQTTKRYTRSIESTIEQLLERLGREPVSFNRGFNFAINKRLGQLLDIEANLLAGLRFETRASGQSSNNFQVTGRIEPRLSLESIVGPAKMEAKKLLQRVSSKSALAFRFAYKNNELVDLFVELPMNTMELFTYESQMVERSERLPYSYNYLPGSIYGQEDIYSPDEEILGIMRQQYDMDSAASSQKMAKIAGRKIKRSIFTEDDFDHQTVYGSQKKSNLISKLMGGKRHFAYELETPVEVARATGMHGKIRLYASPKDMSYLVQCLVHKHESSMRGYRVQVQKSSKRVNGQTEQYLVSVSTPGSRLDRTMQIRLVKQHNSQRTLVKSELRSPFVEASGQLELVHDQREYAVKMELASGKQQWRHALQFGVQRNGQSQSGRVAQTYRPYLTIDSSSLRRPIQMQGVVSYQQSPKSVISYEFKQPASQQNYVRGKIVFDLKEQRGQQGFMRRSMQSPWEILLQQSMSLSNEFTCQLEQHAVKLNHMLDWDAQSRQLNTDLLYSYKSTRDQRELQLLGKLRANEDKMEMEMERRCPQQPHREYKLQLEAREALSKLQVEYRYQDRRSAPVSQTGGQYKHIVAYKHQLDQLDVKCWKKLAFNYQLELMSSEHKLNEQFTGLVKYNLEPRESQKYVRVEMQGRNQKVAQLKVDYVDLEQHLVELQIQGQQWQHRTTCRADQRQMSLKSVTERRQQVVSKIVLELLKESQELQCVFEMPGEKVSLVADLKLVPGKRSSIAMQSPRFVGKTEFEVMQPINQRYSSLKVSPMFWGGIRFMSELKDVKKQQQYWLESQIVADQKLAPKSYLRVSSPQHRADLEYDLEQQTAKWGVFARHPRSGQFATSKLYTTDESIIEQPFELELSGQKELGQLLDQDKIWMVRSLVEKFSPRCLFELEQLKQVARRVVFEFANKRQSQRHFINYQPQEEQFKFHFERQPSTLGQKMGALKPLRFFGDLTTSNKRPSTMHMDTEDVDFDFEGKPFDGEEFYGKLSGLSRNRRSAPFKKHESELRYNKHHGYKAWMKHLDQDDLRHVLNIETDKQPQRWAKMSFDSDKLGKAAYQHQFRHEKSLGKRATTDEDVYKNRLYFSYKPQQQAAWGQEHSLDWDEPASYHQRVRRDISSQSYFTTYDNAAGFLGKLASKRYSVADYLRHVRQARLNSQLQHQLNKQQSYKLDFDYQPEDAFVNLSYNMPQEIEHNTRFEYQPSERLYKLHSKMTDKRQQQPVYELMAASKQWNQQQDQEQFFQQQQPASLLSNLFKQPLELSYSDKFGRQARLDYDQLPSSQQKLFAGLRQKRANVYFKGQDGDFEQQSTFDFYPETMFAYNKQQQQPEIVIKSQTKYGPVVVRADSDNKNVQVEIESPVVSAKLTGETLADGRSQIVKIFADNKRQQVKLAKIVRQTPVICELELIEKLAKMVDERRVEHETELLVGIVDAILKVRSQTKIDGRQAVVVEGELNQQLNKMVVKIEGERVQGKLVVDQVSKAAELQLFVDNKQTLMHETRIVPVSDKFFTIQSFTSYKNKPVFEIQGKIPTMVIEQPEHLFSKHAQRFIGQRDQHITSIEAKIYGKEPKLIKGQFDCLKKELVVRSQDVKSQKQTTMVAQYDEQRENVNVDFSQTRFGTPSFSVTKTINVTPFIKVY